MKVKTKIKLIMLMLVVMAAALFAGCTIGPDSLDTFIEKNELYASVTYYGNGGVFDNNANRTSYVIYYKADQPAMEITSETTNARVSYTRYVLTQWVYVETDSETGEPVFEDEEKKTPKLTDRVVDFNTLVLKSGDNLHIAAVWALDVLLEYYLVSDNPVTIAESTVNAEGNTVIVNKTYQPGEVFYSESYGATGRLSIMDTEKVQSTDSTYLEYYEDEACSTSALNKIYLRPEDGVNAKIYAKYITGNYTVVKNASQVSAMFTTGLTNSTRSYYIYNDIDCTSLFTSTSSYWSMSSSTFRCSIEGNGYTISNLKFRSQGIAAGLTCSMLGSFASSAKINNLTLSGIEITATVRGDFPNIYLINGGIESGATLTNFSVKNITLDISEIADQVTIDNIPTNGSGGYTTDHWVFGGADTDADFISTHTGVSVTSATLKIKGTTYVENTSFGTT